jgi:uncharacterized protein (TIGR00369 family)
MSEEERDYALGFLFGPGRDEMVSYTPHAAHLGIKVVEIGAHFALVKLPYRSEIVGDPQRGVVFGGAITTLLDHASGIAVACSLKELCAIATVDLRIDYLRAADPGRDLFGRVECYHLTRNVAFVRGTAYEDDPQLPFASMLATMMIGANPTESPWMRLAREPEETQ